MRYFTPENSVTASINLYQKRFKIYFKISLISYLWLLVPLYGWAKCYAGLAVISRLAFSEIKGQVETINEAKNHINPITWKFLSAAFLSFLIVTSRGLFWLILWAIYWGIISSAVALWFQFLLSLNYSLILLVMVAFVGINLLINFWFLLKLIEIYSPFFIYDVPLAIEEDLTSSTTIYRSRKLTEGLKKPVVKVVIIASLITFLLSFICQFLFNFFGGLLIGLIQQFVFIDIQGYNPAVVEIAVSFIYSIGFGIIIAPFWQILKSIMYYNLCCQKEGFDLPTTLSSNPWYQNTGDFIEIGNES